MHMCVLCVVFSVAILAISQSRSPPFEALLGALALSLVGPGSVLGSLEGANKRERAGEEATGLYKDARTLVCVWFSRL